MHKIIFLFIFISSAQADVFKCVHNSKVVYSQMPCGAGSVSFDSENISVFPAYVDKIKFGQAVDFFVVNYSKLEGGFFISGNIDGVVVRAQIDTGATITTISGAVAYRLGLKTCNVAGVSNTAAGKVNYCRLQVKRLSVGGMNFDNVTVHVLPKMSGDMLFGADLLLNLHVVHHAGVLTISR